MDANEVREIVRAWSLSGMDDSHYWQGPHIDDSGAEELWEAIKSRKRRY